MLVVPALALALFLLQAATADAVFHVSQATPRPSEGGPKHRNGDNCGARPGPAGVQGFIANTDSPFDPVADGYPANNPTEAEGFTPKDEGFAGVIHGTPTGGGDQLNLYCIDIFTITNIGVGYGYGTWDAASVPNVGYVARLLNEYYPATDEPAALTDLNQKAAAVQAAIWFFSDRYVLSTSSPLHDTVVDIVNRIRAGARWSSPQRPASRSLRRTRAVPPAAPSDHSL